MRASIVTRLQAGWLGLDSQWGWEVFSSTPCPDWFQGSAILLSTGYWGLFLWG